MTIKATVEEARIAFRAFTRINEEVRLHRDAAWSVARMLRKLKPHVLDFEQTQCKLYKDRGGLLTSDGSIILRLAPREESESQMAFAARETEHLKSVDKITSDLLEIGRKEIEIELDPIPLGLFREEKDDEKLPADKRRRYSANDFANCGPFISDEEAKKED